MQALLALDWRLIRKLVHKCPVVCWVLGVVIGVSFWIGEVSIHIIALLDSLLLSIVEIWSAIQIWLRDQVISRRCRIILQDVHIWWVMLWLLWVVSNHCLRALYLALIWVLLICVCLTRWEFSHVPKVLRIINEICLTLVDLILELAVDRILMISSITYGGTIVWRNEFRHIIGILSDLLLMSTLLKHLMLLIIMLIWAFIYKTIIALLILTLFSFENSTVLLALFNESIVVHGRVGYLFSHLFNTAVAIFNLIFAILIDMHRILLDLWLILYVRFLNACFILLFWLRK